MVTAEIVNAAVEALEPTGRNKRRDAEIIVRSMMGESLPSIGAEFGMTKERARQIVDQYETRVGRRVRSLFVPPRLPRVPRRSDIRRFFGLLTVDAETGCWVSRSPLSTTGYGQFDDGYAHRWSYKTFVGAIPDGLCIDHLCRNRACANPDHLEPVTQMENVRRSPYKSSNIRCLKGHEFTEANTTWHTKNHKNGKKYRTRVCITCRREYEQAWRARRREAA